MCSEGPGRGCLSACSPKPFVPTTEPAARTIFTARPVADAASPNPGAATLSIAEPPGIKGRPNDAGTSDSPHKEPDKGPTYLPAAAGGSPTQRHSPAEVGEIGCPATAAPMPLNLWPTNRPGSEEVGSGSTGKRQHLDPYPTEGAQHTRYAWGWAGKETGQGKMRQHTGGGGFHKDRHRWWRVGRKRK